MTTTQGWVIIGLFAAYVGLRFWEFYTFWSDMNEREQQGDEFTFGDPLDFGNSDASGVGALYGEDG